MSLRVRRGTALAELLVAVTMLGVVAAVLFRMIAGSMRLYQSQTQFIDRGQNLRAAAELLHAELRELSATDGDIYSATPTGLSFRAMRRLGFVCGAPRPGATHLAVRASLLSGTRDFDPMTDSLLVLAARDPGGDWLPSAFTDVRNGACDDGSPARLLASELAADPRLEIGAPVRAFESVTYRLYRSSDGESQLGMASRGDVIQPVVGPLAGLELVYRDATGTPTGVLRDIAAIEIKLRILTSQPVRGSQGVLTRQVDSLITVVALRNNRRAA